MLSKGELYTTITNKSAKNRKEAILDILTGTKVELITKQLFKITYSKRSKVDEITLEMANSMKVITTKCFPKAM